VFHYFLIEFDLFHRAIDGGKYHTKELTMSPSQYPSISPMPKMVTNSFGKKNSCSQWEGSTCIHNVPCFSFWGWGGGGELFFVEICDQNLSLPLAQVKYGSKKF
jgi:hypothetical protein